jgi:hypothetical protein
MGAKGPCDDIGDQNTARNTQDDLNNSPCGVEGIYSRQAYVPAGDGGSSGPRVSLMAHPGSCLSTKRGVRRRSRLQHRGCLGGFR